MKSKNQDSLSIGLQNPSQVINQCRLGLGGVVLEGVEVLAGLGLSGRQAHVYLATLKLGSGKVQAIAELSGVSRQEIYRLMEGLQEIGLMQKNLTNPTTYTATPINQTTSMLLKQKTLELNGLSAEMKQLVKKLTENGCTNPFSVGLLPCFGTISEADRGKKYRQALTGTKNSFEGVLSWRRFKQVNIHCQEQLQEALVKGVDVRLVIEKPANYHLPKWIPTAVKDHPNFKLRTLQATPNVAVSIFDESCADIAFEPNSSLTKGLDLWTTAPSLLALTKEYLNATWTQAKIYRH